MLVYASTFWTAQEVDRNRVLGVIASWLSFKTQTTVSADTLSRTNEPRVKVGRLSVVASDFEFPQLAAIRYSHADREVTGRQWITDIGLRRESAAHSFECSIQVRTSEISARVISPVAASRPGIVNALASSGLLKTTTPGYRLNTLDDDAHTAEAFLYGIEADNRKFPYVLISATPEGKYLVDPERTRSLLIGLAEVVAIPPSADTFFLSRALGSQYAAWRGAINIIFPKVRFPDKSFVETRRLRPEDISALLDRGSSGETEILSMITHRTNLPMSWRSITLEAVQESILRRELTARMQDAKKSGDQSEYVRLLEENDVEQSKKINDLQATIEARDQELAAQQSTERRLRWDLEQATSVEGSEGESDGGMDNDYATAILSVIDGDAAPAQSLRVVATLYRERLIVLQSAWRSAKESAGFEEPQRLFELLRKLATDYWQAMVDGKGDLEAKQVFGNAFAARESETVESNAQACKLRTFEYNGEPVLMLRHLKIGRKDSASKTIRVHFHWDAASSKVVVGHCGPHLDFD